MSVHDPVSDEFRAQMNTIAKTLDHAFNGDGPRSVGFSLLVYEFGKATGGRVNYISNGQRDDVKVAMKELLSRWEGRPFLEGHA